VLPLLTQRYELLRSNRFTLVTATGSYLLVEEFKWSGVIGVVTTGLVIGNSSVLNSEQNLWKRATMILEFVIFVNSLILPIGIHLPARSNIHRQLLIAVIIVDTSTSQFTWLQRTGATG